MKLQELVYYLMDSERLKGLYQELDLNTQSEALLIYMHEALTLEADIAILEIEETTDDLVFEKEGTQYFQLFPVDYAMELIESDLNLKGKGYSDLEIAKKLLEYRLTNA